MRTVVEGMLPAQFLLDLGTYMQTAAHIELAVWQTTMHAEGIDPHSAEEYRGYVGLKLNARENAVTCADFEARQIVLISDEAHHLNAETKAKLDKEEEDEKVS